jgi:hypothetical protein
VEHRLLLKTTKELMTGLLPVKLNPTEWYQEQEGYKRIMIATEAIKRLGYE